MFRDCFPINAACEAPSPGRNAVKGAAIIEASEDLKIEIFDSLMFFREVVLCSGIFVFCFMLIRRLDAPKRPVNNGRSGWLMFMFKEAIPKNPARRNMINAQSFLSGSVVIKKSETVMRRIGIIVRLIVLIKGSKLKVVTGV